MIDFNKPKKLNKKLFSKENNEEKPEEEISEIEKPEEAIWIKENYSEVIKDAENKIAENRDEESADTVKRKVDLKRYKDPEGLSVEKMEIGLWYIKNRGLIIKLLVGMVILINVLVWPKFLYSFGEYLIFGIREDRATMKGLTSSTLFDHNYIISISPKPIKIKEVKVLEQSGDKFDVYALIENSSEKHWAHFDYFFSAGNKVISSSSSFILPGESKYLLGLHKTSETSLSNPTITIENIQWDRVNNHKYPDWDKFAEERTRFEFEDKEFIPAQTSVLTEKVNLNELKFKAINNTDYNFWSVRFIILIGGRNGIAGVNQYIVEKMMSGTDEDISVVWPGNFSRIQDITIIPEIDLSREDIYMDF